MEQKKSPRSVVGILLRALPLSVAVMLRMIPIYLLTTVIIGGLGYAAFRFDQLGFTILAVILGTPTSYFFFISSIRAGLQQLRQTTPPDMGKVIKSSFVMPVIHVGVILPFLFVMGGVVALAVQQGWIDRALFEIPSAMWTPEMLWNAFGIWLLGICVGLAALLASIYVPSAARAASCVHKREPNHGYLWGFGRALPTIILATILTNAVVWVVTTLLWADLLQASLIVDTTDLDAIVAILRQMAIVLGVFLLVAYWQKAYMAGVAALAYVAVRDKWLEGRERALKEYTGTLKPDTPQEPVKFEYKKNTAGAVLYPAPSLTAGSSPDPVYPDGPDPAQEPDYDTGHDGDSILFPDEKPPQAAPFMAPPHGAPVPKPPSLDEGSPGLDPESDESLAALTKSLFGVDMTAEPKGEKVETPPEAAEIPPSSPSAPTPEPEDISHDRLINPTAARMAARKDAPAAISEEEEEELLRKLLGGDDPKTDQ